MTEDPAGYVDGGSLYQAYRGGPVGAVDPMGLFGVFDDVIWSALPGTEGDPVWDLWLSNRIEAYRST